MSGFVAFHYKSYGTFCLHEKSLYLQSGVTHYRNYRAKKSISSDENML